VLLDIVEAMEMHLQRESSSRS